MKATTVALQTLCQIKSGGTPSKANGAFWKGDIPWISPKDMKSSLLTDANDHISPEAVGNSATSIVPEGSILVVVRSGILAHTLPVAQVGRPLAFNQDIKALIPDGNKIDPDYLYWFLRGSEKTVLACGVKKGATVHSVQSGFIEKLEVPLVLREEQRKIVDILSRAEGIVRLRHDAQRKAQEIIPALFLDMFGDPATNPKGWPKTSVGDVIASADYGSSTKASDNGTGVPLIRMGNVDFSGYLQLNNLKYVNLAPEDIERFGLIEGDILFNRTNSKDLVGKTGLWDGSRTAVAASYFIRVRIAKGRINPFFFWAFMNSAHMKRVLFDTARGAIGQSNINARELKSFEIVVPPLDWQNVYEKRCRDLFAIQSQQSSALEKAQASFDALLARIFRN